MITVTFIRHGESEDNPRGIWAGWKDAPLSELGNKQAQAVGTWFSETRIDYIYASPLRRAFTTGKAVHEAQPHDPPFRPHPKLREQHFGVAEGHPWVVEIPDGEELEDLFHKRIFPVLPARHLKFLEGESLEDLARRAEEAIAECVIPHLEEDNAHVAIASHGLCISELIAALLRLDPGSRHDISYTGLLNTAWTRVTISLPDDHYGPVHSFNLPPLKVLVTDVNKYDHLVSIPVIVDSSGVDETLSQTEARAFFGGAKI